MLKNKKFLVILLLTLILLIFSVSSCFASSTLINSLNVRDYYSLIEDYCNTKGWSICDYIITSTESQGFIYIYPSNTYRCFVEYNSTHGNLIKTEACKIFCFNDINNPYSYSIVDGSNFVQYTSADCIIWSSFDINNADGTLFFQKTPLSQGILAPIMGEAKPEMPQVMKEITGILPLIIVVVVSLVGLRKALQMLSMLLRKA